MMFHALLVSKENDATAVLDTVFSGFGLATVCCGYPEAICQLSEQKFDVVVVDFDDPHSAALVLQNVHQASSADPAVTVALLDDRTKLRHALGQGANFVLYKPLSLAQAETSLRAAAALLKRERRSSYRVPLQLPIQLKLQDAPNVEGILLDLSETGMDVLAAQPLCPTAQIGARFTLPDGKTELEVRGEVTRANPNGESGVRFMALSDNTRAILKAWISANAPEPLPTDLDGLTQSKLTDLSLGGCYLETESPFPEHAVIMLCLKAEDVDAEVGLEGRVRVMHPGFGMGIEFVLRTEEERVRLEQFIGLLAGQPGTLPAVLITPLALAANDDSTSSGVEDLADPLLELLRRTESLSQEEFLQELRRQRSGKVTTAPLA
jgi:CheY-like chemotaxis protein